MAEEHDDMDDVERRLKEIQLKRRSRVQWRVSKHTAELAIDALNAGPKRPRRPAGSKSRRRKRWKRLL